MFVLCVTTDVASECCDAFGHRALPVQKAFHAHVMAALKNNVLIIMIIQSTDAYAFQHHRSAASALQAQ